MRQLLIPAALSAVLLIATAPAAPAQIVVQYGTPTYSYTPYPGGYYQPQYQPYYQPYYQSYGGASYAPSYGGSISLGRGGLSVDFGTTPYYGGSYRSYYGSPSYYGNPGWSNGYRGYSGGWRGGYRR